jgi:hypothetical protein
MNQKLLQKNHLEKIIDLLNQRLLSNLGRGREQKSIIKLSSVSYTMAKKYTEKNEAELTEEEAIRLVVNNYHSLTVIE